MSDEAGDEESYGNGYSSVGGYPWSTTNGNSFGSCYAVYSGPNFDSATSGLSSYYDRAASSLVASISASASPAPNQTASHPTDYDGLFGSAITPAGGVEIDAGLYFNNAGVGGFLSFGTPTGIPSASLGVLSGHTQSLAGDSISTSLGASYGIVAVSKGWSIDPATGQTRGDQWSAGLSIGPKLGASAGFSTTVTSEFTSLYIAYIQFLNWVGYPGNNSIENGSF